MGQGMVNRRAWSGRAHPRFSAGVGGGFSFVGSQYPLDVAGPDWFLDLLFYHLKLRCYVVVELKATDFKPEYAGKMPFCLSACRRWTTRCAMRAPRRVSV